MSGNASMVVFAFVLQWFAVSEGRRLILTSTRAACPPEVSENSKGDCVDKEGKIVDSTCCNRVHACKADVEAAEATLSARLHEFMNQCGVAQDDLKKNAAGFEVVNTSHLCSPTCEAVGSKVTQMPDFDALEKKCGSTDHLANMVHMVTTLQAAWNGCVRSIECPPKVFETNKDDCVDEQGKFVNLHCCDKMHNCEDEIDKAQDAVDMRIHEFMNQCGLQESDLKMGASGFEVVSTEHLCAPKCELIGSRATKLPDVDAIQKKCGSADRLVNMWNLATTLQNAWDRCSDISPSSCPEDGTVFGSSAGDCADVHGAKLPSECCKVVDDCEEEITNTERPIATHFNDYVKICKLLKPDLIEKPNGDYRVTDTTRLCAELCETVGNQSVVVPPLTDLDSKCGKGGAKPKLDVLKTVSKKVVALDTAWKACEELFVVDDSEHNLIFLIDRSGSMVQQFKPKGGKRQTRLKFAQEKLAERINALGAEDRFNIIAFDSRQALFQDSFVTATDENKKNAEAFINKLRPGGGTGIKRALKSAFDTEGVDAIYLLSDGHPSDCHNARSCLPSIASSGAVPVHTTLFMPGSQHVTYEEKILKRIAQITKGSFRKPFN